MLLDANLALDGPALRLALREHAQSIQIKGRTVGFKYELQIAKFLQEKWPCDEPEALLKRVNSTEDHDSDPLGLALYCDSILFADLALIALGLFGSAETAFDELRKLQQTGPATLPARGEPISEWKLRSAYRNAKGNVRKMEDDLGRSRHSIRRLLVNRGLPRFPAKFKPEELQAIIAFWDGAELSAACQIHKAEPDAVVAALRQCIEPAVSQLQQFES